VFAAEVDRATTDYFHIAGAALMETAGRAVAKLALERGAESHPVVVLCGNGNNGGDGLVAARLLHDKGCRVTIVTATEPGRQTSPLFDQQQQTIELMGLSLIPWQPGTLLALGLTRPIIIDAVSGIGFKPPANGLVLELLTEAAKLPAATVIAVDLPSGLSCDDGSTSTALLKAHDSITFGSARPIHRLMPSATLCGNITVADIGFPVAAINKTLSQRQVIWRETDPTSILMADPWRLLPKGAHKYDRGHVLVIGGSDGKIGAAILAGLAALRTGAGWSSLAVPRGHSPVDMPIPTELTVESFFDGELIDAQKLRQFLEDRRVVCIIVGPGWTKQALDMATLRVLNDFALAGGRVILDAGALHNITPLVSRHGPLSPNGFILTPHHGEWMKLGDEPALPPLTPGGVLSSTKLAQAMGTHIIYKNAAPVIIAPDGSSPIVCISGSPALARAGSGDLLTGILAAHLAAGCSMPFAASRSYTLLARSAWLAVQEVGDDAVLASDVLSRIGIAGRV
jgi:NAD(P)H-hydrate epimerase